MKSHTLMKAAVFWLTALALVGCIDSKKLDATNKALAALLNGGFGLDEAGIIAVEIEKSGKIETISSVDMSDLATTLHRALVSSSDSVVRNYGFDQKRVGTIRIKTTRGEGFFPLYECIDRPKLYRIKTVHSGDIGSGSLYLNAPQISVLE